MPSFSPSLSFSLGVLVLLVFAVRPARAFGAGNIASVSKIEGQNWRHGDIEDTLLNLLIAQAAGGRKFSKLDVKRIYFGNWLRDYSQAVDVGTVKSVSAEAIRILLWILGFLSFGYGTHEFEVTAERLGCYRPEEHIDNPLGYPPDAKNYDRRLRGPVDEGREVSVDPETGLKNYIASEDLGITTSAGLIRELFGKCIELGRQYAQSEDDADLHEALRLLGTGCHCLEDFSAHSNFVELALIELGERDVFPHVGRRTEIELQGAREPVYPLITGTFGGVDFLHSVVGEISDKAVQSEIQELEGTMQQSQASEQSSSMLHNILEQLPSGLLGGGDQSAKMDELEENAQAAQMQDMDISPREPEAWTRRLHEATKQIYPVLEWHDQIMKSINRAIEKIPVLPDLIEQFQERLNIFVFSLIAPFVMPIIGQIKTELVAGSSVIIKSSKHEQLNVFHDDDCSDPTHSMLSKDHFSNVLNEPAGRIASQILKWVVPQMMEAWDDEGVDVDDTLTRIIYGVFHHPALRHDGHDGAAECRQQMFNVVEEWWGAKDESERDALREQLSRDGVEHGRNHKEGVHDSGHGCGKPLGMPTYQTASSSGALGGAAGRSKRRRQADEIAAGVGNVAGKAAGGGALGGMVSGIIGGVGASLLGGAFGGGDEKESYSEEESHDDGSYTQTRVEAGHHRKEHDDDREYYAQAQYSQTSYPGGGGREEYQRYEQPASGAGSGGYGYQEVHTARPSYEDGYEQTAETRHLRPGEGWETEQRHEGRSGWDDDQYGSQDRYQQTDGYGAPGYGSRRKDSDSEDDDDDDDDEKRREKQRKREKKERKRREKEHKKMYGSGGDDDDDSDSDEKHGRRYGSSDRYRGSSPRRDHGESTDEYGSGGYGSRGYGDESREYSDASRSRLESSGYGEGGESRYGSSSYGGGAESGYGGVDRREGGYGRGDDEHASGYGGTGSSGYGTSSGYAGGDSSTQFERGGSGYGGSSGYGTGGGYAGGDSGHYGGEGSAYGGGGGGSGGYGRSSGYGEDTGYGREGNQYGGGGGGEYGRDSGYGGNTGYGREGNGYNGGGGYGQEGEGGYDARRRGYGDGGY